MTLVVVYLAQWVLMVCGQEPFVDVDHPPELEPVEDSLKYVFAISRVGSRAPIFDPVLKEPIWDDFKKYWGTEKGQLLQEGERLMAALGKSLYSRYKNILQNPSTTKQITSHRCPRAVRSAQVVGEHLFGSDQLTSTSTDDFDKYQVLSEPDKDVCKRYSQERKRTHTWEVLNSDISWQDDDNDMISRAEELRNLTGVKGKLTRLDLLKVWDTYYMMRVAKKEVPKNIINLMVWKDLWDETHDFVSGGDHYLTGDYSIGPLFNQILQEMYNCTENCKGFHVHVTHSLTLSAMLGALGLLMFKPHVGTTVIVELHEENMVRLLLYQPLDFMQPGTLHQARDRSPLVLAMEALCHDWDMNSFLAPIECHIDRFRAKLPVVSPQKWQQECEKLT